MGIICKSINIGGIKKEIFVGDNNHFIENEKIVKASKSICKISYNIDPNSKAHGTGFFMSFLHFNRQYRFLVTNYHVISENLINKEIEIELYKKIIINLKLVPNLLSIDFFKDQFDVTVIQINDNNFEIMKNVEFLNCDMNYLNGYDKYINEEAFAVGYPMGGVITTSLGKIIKINGHEFEHNIPTKVGSSGSPVISLNDVEIIGIHKQGNINKNMNEGTFIGIIIDKLKDKLKDKSNKDSITNQNENEDYERKGKDENKLKINQEAIANKFNKGKIIKSYANNGNRYEGGFKNGLKEGKGKDYLSNGDIYDGFFKNGVREGKGIYYWPDGDRYEGDFKNGVREGKGKMYCNNGDIYEGEYKNDKLEGFGKKIGKNGDRYEGGFKNNKPEGKGKAYHKNGNRYEGEFKNGIPEGKGIMHYADGNRYEGEYKNGVPEGKGIFYMNNGDRYEGDFKDGKPEGRGIMYHENGDRYEGEYKDGKPEGQGKMYSRNE